MGLFDNTIPKILMTSNSWVCARSGSKVPITPVSLDYASVSKPESWGSFDEATQEVISENADGIGYVFHDNGIVGIDIDTGYDDEGFLTDLAMDIITLCKSYTEISRSGRGFHIFLKGNLPFKGRNNQNGVEIYKDKRWFITTGNVVFFEDVIENQEAIDYIVDKYFPEVKENKGNSLGMTIYTADVEKKDKNIQINYPPITEGGRNVCLASIAGQLHTAGFSRAFIFNELLHVNKIACKPMLPRREVEAVTSSICRYAR